MKKSMLVAAVAAFAAASVSAAGYVAESGASLVAVGEGITLDYAAKEAARLLARAGVNVAEKGAASAEAGVFALKFGDEAAVPSVKSVKDDGFVVKADAKSLVIASTSAKGVLNGLYTVAAEAGFAFLYPGEAGEVVPEKLAAIADEDKFFRNLAKQNI